MEEMVVLGGSDDDNADAAELESLAEELGRVARSKRKSAAVMVKLDALLDKLDEGDFKALLDHPTIQKLLDHKAKSLQKDGDPPGTIYFLRGIPFSKKPWTEADLRKSSIPIVEFELEEAVEFVGWNGLRRSYGPGVHRDYACFRDQIRHARDQRRFAEEHRKFMLPNPGETARFHPDMMDEATMRVRAIAATGGSEYVGSGTVEGIAYEDEAASA